MATQQNVIINDDSEDGLTKAMVMLSQAISQIYPTLINNRLRASSNVVQRRPIDARMLGMLGMQGIIHKMLVTQENAGRKFDHMKRKMESTDMVADKAFCIVFRATTLLLRYHYLIFAMSSDDASSTVTYTSVSSDSREQSAWGIPLMNAGEISNVDPYEEVAQHGQAHLLSPAYVSDPIEFDEHVPLYVPEHPEYYDSSEDVVTQYHFHFIIETRKIR
ncbi:hypothetical protein Tco_0701074 [Tanacetum coccineum]